MKTFTATCLLAVGLASASALPTASGALAQSPAAARIFEQLDSGKVATSYSQFRRGFRGRGYGYRGGYGRRYGYGYRRRGFGGGALIGGLAAGALIGGAIASQAQPAPVYAGSGGDAVDYCVQRFKSYDPASGTYLGYDGVRHACP